MDWLAVEAETKRLHAIYMEHNLSVAQVAAIAGMKRNGLQHRFDHFELPPKPVAFNPQVVSIPVSEMFAKYDGGVTLKELEKNYGYSGTTILKYFRKAGLKTKRVVNKEKLDNVAEMYKKYINGTDINVVAREYKLWAKTILTAFKDRGLKLKPQVAIEKKLKKRLNREKIVTRSLEVMDGFIAYREERFKFNMSFRLGASA
jgi:Mor family transcriptional regulator